MTINDVPTRRTWKIVAGDDVVRSFRVKVGLAGESEPWDLTSVTIRGQVREADGTLLAEFTVTKANQTTDKGVYTLALSDSDTINFPTTSYGDVEFVTGGLRRTFQRFTFKATEKETIVA